MSKPDRSEVLSLNASLASQLIRGDFPSTQDSSPGSRAGSVCGPPVGLLAGRPSRAGSVCSTARVSPHGDDSQTVYDGADDDTQQSKVDTRRMAAGPRAVHNAQKQKKTTMVNLLIGPVCGGNFIVVARHAKQWNISEHMLP